MRDNVLVHIHFIQGAGSLNTYNVGAVRCSKLKFYATMLGKQNLFCDCRYTRRNVLFILAGLAGWFTISTVGVVVVMYMTSS